MNKISEWGTSAVSEVNRIESQRGGRYRNQPGHVIAAYHVLTIIDQESTMITLNQVFVNPVHASSNICIRSTFMQGICKRMPGRYGGTKKYIPEVSSIGRRVFGEVLDKLGKTQFYTRLQQL